MYGSLAVFGQAQNQSEPWDTLTSPQSGNRRHTESSDWQEMGLHDCMMELASAGQLQRPALSPGGLSAPLWAAGQTGVQIKSNFKEINWPCRLFPGKIYCKEPTGFHLESFLSWSWSLIQQWGHANKYTSTVLLPPTSTHTQTHTSVTTLALLSLCRVCFEWVGQSAVLRPLLSTWAGVTERPAIISSRANLTLVCLGVSWHISIDIRRQVEAEVVGGDSCRIHL